jgi:predicted O-methyltransferase YrrM
MNQVLANILATKQVKTPGGSSLPLDYHISADEGAAIQRLIRTLKPRVTLEIGFAYGISTLYICESLVEVGGERHIVIDPKQQEIWKGIGLFTVERAGYRELVDFRHESSHQALPSLEKEGQRIDFALIDGWHTFDYVLVDFFYVDRLLNVGGVVIFDDTFYYPAIRKVARYVATHRNYVPIANENVQRPSLKRRVFNAATFALRQRPISVLATRLVRPDILRPDHALGLPLDNFIAFRKVSDDLHGDGSNRTRKWDQHIDF